MGWRYSTLHKGRLWEGRGLSALPARPDSGVGGRGLYPSRQREMRSRGVTYIPLAPARNEVKGRGLLPATGARDTIRN